MPPALRLSHQALRVLKVFLTAFSDDVRSEIAGVDLMRMARLSSGTLYPILVRFEKAGLLTSRWEEGRPETLGRPRRRFYRITSSGAELAHDVLRELSSPFGDLMPNEV